SFTLFGASSVCFRNLPYLSSIGIQFGNCGYLIPCTSNPPDRISRILQLLSDFRIPEPPGKNGALRCDFKGHRQMAHLLEAGANAVHDEGGTKTDGHTQSPVDQSLFPVDLAVPNPIKPTRLRRCSKPAFHADGKKACCP